MIVRRRGPSRRTHTYRRTYTPSYRRATYTFPLVTPKRRPPDDRRTRREILRSTFAPETLSILESEREREHFFARRICAESAEAKLRRTRNRAYVNVRASRTRLSLIVSAGNIARPARFREHVVNAKIIDPPSPKNMSRNNRLCDIARVTFPREPRRGREMYTHKSINKHGNCCTNSPPNHQGWEVVRDDVACFSHGRTKTLVTARAYLFVHLFLARVV